MDNLETIDIEMLKLWIPKEMPYTSHYDSKKRIMKMFGYRPDGTCVVKTNKNLIYVGDMTTAVKIYNEL